MDCCWQCTSCIAMVKVEQEAPLHQSRRKCNVRHWIRLPSAISWLTIGSLALWDEAGLAKNVPTHTPTRNIQAVGLKWCLPWSMSQILGHMRKLRPRIDQVRLLQRYPFSLFVFIFFQEKFFFLKKYYERKKKCFLFKLSAKFGWPARAFKTFANR